MSKSPKELCVDVFTLEMKAAERLDSLVADNEPEEVESAVRETVNDLFPTMDTPQRKGRVILFAHEIAQEINSEELAQETKRRYVEFVEDQENGK